MKTRIYFLAFYLTILFLVFGNTQASYSVVINNLFTQKITKLKVVQDLKNTDAAILKIDKSLINTIHNSNELTIKNVSFGNSNGNNFQLMRVNSIIDENTRILTGNDTQMNLPEISRFKGSILNESGSEVYLTVVNDNLIFKITIVR